jgi:hypothetical protein
VRLLAHSGASPKPATERPWSQSLPCITTPEHASSTGASTSESCKVCQGGSTLTQEPTATAASLAAFVWTMRQALPAGRLGQAQLQRTSCPSYCIACTCTTISPANIHPVREPSRVQWWVVCGRCLAPAGGWQAASHARAPDRRSPMPACNTWEQRGGGNDDGSILLWLWALHRWRGGSKGRSATTSTAQRELLTAACTGGRLRQGGGDTAACASACLDAACAHVACCACTLQLWVHARHRCSRAGGRATRHVMVVRVGLLRSWCCSCLDVLLDMVIAGAGSFVRSAQQPAVHLLFRCNKQAVLPHRSPSSIALNVMH